MDVPDDGSHLYVYAGFTGKGRMQVEGLTLEAVGQDVVLSPLLPIRAPGPMAALAPEYGNDVSLREAYSGSGFGGGPPYTPPQVWVAPAAPPAR